MFGLACVTQLYLTERNAQSHSTDAEEQAGKTCQLQAEVVPSTPLPQPELREGCCTRTGLLTAVPLQGCTRDSAAVPGAVDSDPVPGDQQQTEASY